MKLSVAQTISEFGARFSAVGLRLTAVLTLHAGPRQAGLLVALATAPRVVIGLLARGYIDRSRRRRTMILSDLVRAALLATVPAAALAHLLSLPQLYAVTFLIACASVVFDIANQAYFPALVDSGHLAEGNTKLSVTASLANVGGPAITGFLIQLFSAPLAIGVTTLSYIGSAAFLARVNDEERPPPPRPDKWLHDFVTGSARSGGTGSCGRSVSWTRVRASSPRASWPSTPSSRFGNCTLAPSCSGRRSRRAASARSAEWRCVPELPGGSASGPPP